MFFIYGFCLVMLKLFCSIFIYVNDYARALCTAIHIYLIGIYYVLYEFIEDCRTGLKTVRNDPLFHEKLREWTKTLKKLQKKEQENLDRSAGGKDDEQEKRKLVAVVTGGEGTIGNEIVNYLISLDFLVFTIGANPPAKFPHVNLQFIKCDLSARNEVFEAVERIQMGCDQVDLLILNAAIMLQPGFGFFPYRQDILGQSIVERHLAINVLANAQIFASLTPRMECSHLKNPRAIFVSSSVAHAGEISLLLKDEERFWCRHLNGYKSYADSKLLCSIYVKYLSRVLKSRGRHISVASVHPGVVPGKLYRHVFRPIRCLINSILAPFIRTPRQAATFVLDLAFSPDIQEGEYYENGVPTNLKAAENSEDVWLYGKSVRDMIMDNDAPSSFLSESATDGGLLDGNGTTIYESIISPSSASLYTECGPTFKLALPSDHN